MIPTRSGIARIANRDQGNFTVIVALVTVIVVMMLVFVIMGGRGTSWSS